MAELYMQHLDGNTTTRSLPQSAVMLSSVPSRNPLVSKGSEMDPIGMLHQASRVQKRLILAHAIH